MFSTILLIVIVVIGMTVAFGFFVNYVRDYQTGSGSSVLEAAEIEDVWFRHTNYSNTEDAVDVNLTGLGAHSSFPAQQAFGMGSDTLTEANTAASIAFDNASSVEAATMTASVSWSHTTTTASNRLLVVAVNVYAATGTPTTVSNVTYGDDALDQVTTALYSTADPQVRTYIFRLVNPQSGTQTVTVTFAASTLYVCGAVTYTNVDQTTPIQTSQTATDSSTSPSVSLSCSWYGKSRFWNLSRVYNSSNYRTSDICRCGNWFRNNEWKPYTRIPC